MWQFHVQSDSSMFGLEAPILSLTTKSCYNSCYNLVLVLCSFLQGHVQFSSSLKTMASQTVSCSSQQFHPRSNIKCHHPFRYFVDQSDKTPHAISENHVQSCNPAFSTKTHCAIWPVPPLCSVYHLINPLSSSTSSTDQVSQYRPSTRRNRSALVQGPLSAPPVSF